LAWLHATPKGAKKSRLASLPDKILAQLPPLAESEYLAQWWADCGYCESSGGYPVALSWGEIRAWADLSATALAPWEAELLRSASLAYVNGLSAYADPHCPNPYQPETYSTDYVNAVRAQIKTALRR
jgi:hypothetical protein